MSSRGNLVFLVVMGVGLGSSLAWLIDGEGPLWALVPGSVFYLAAIVIRIGMLLSDQALYVDRLVHALEWEKAYNGALRTELKSRDEEIITLKRGR